MWLFALCILLPLIPYIFSFLTSVFNTCISAVSFRDSLWHRIIFSLSLSHSGTCFTVQPEPLSQLKLNSLVLEC